MGEALENRVCILIYLKMIGIWPQLGQYNPGPITLDHLANMSKCLGEKCSMWDDETNCCRVYQFLFGSPGGMR